MTAVSRDKLLLFSRPAHFASFFGLLLLLSSLLFSCRPSFRLNTPPNAFPYLFKTVQQVDGEGLFWDLDHNGRDYYLSIAIEPRINHSQFMLHNNDFELIDQVNYTGQLTFFTHFDWTGDGTDEIATTYTRNDSAFLRLVNRQGQILKEGFLFKGKPRVSKSGTFSWNGHINGIRYADLDGDGKKEILIFPSEGFAAKPRGVFVYDGHTLRLKWKYEIGAAVAEEPIVLDTNHDGKFEILMGSSAPCNGNQINGTNDFHSYVFLINHAGKLLWKRIEGGKFTRTEVQALDINGDGNQQVLLSIYKKYSRKAKPAIEIIDPFTGRTLMQRGFPFANPFSWHIGAFQLDRKPDKEFVLANKNGEVFLLNSHFEKFLENHLPFPIEEIKEAEDLNGNGKDEIFVQSNQASFWLNSKCKIQAKTTLHISPDFIFVHKPQVYHRHNQLPLLALYSKRDQNTRLVRLVPNSHYLLAVYGKTIFFFSLGFLFLGLIGWIVTLERKRRFAENLLEKGIGFRQNPVLLLDHRGRISQTNYKAREVLALPNASRPLSIAQIPAKWAPFKQFLRALPEEEPIRQEIRFTEEESEQKFRAVAEPVRYPGPKKYYWLVFLLNISAESRLENAKAWAAIAQRIAHDIKNPLTSILLTQQRLEMEYKRQDPKRAKLYEPYTRRIVNRIEFLRRMTRQFMKFVDVEKINPQPTNVNTFVQDFLSSGVIEWPRDIQFLQKLGTDLPPVFVDQEQLQILMENLISNAINAMPEGGTITLSTSLALNLHFTEQTQGPRNYVAIEILDTGKGIPPGLRDKLFRPFATGTHLGTGLGLTIVKKIVDDHRGHIEIESEEGVGTSIIVYLPVA